MGSVQVKKYMRATPISPIFSHAPSNLPKLLCGNICGAKDDPSSIPGHLRRPLNHDDDTGNGYTANTAISANVTLRTISPAVSFSDNLLFSLLTDKSETSEKEPEPSKRFERMTVTVNSFGYPTNVKNLAQSQGILTKSAHTVFNLYMDPSEKSALNSQGSKKGGHNVNAIIRNTFQNRLWNVILLRHINAIVNGQIYVSVHIGSKFLQVFGLLDEALFLFFCGVAEKLGLHARQRMKDGVQVQAANNTFVDWYKQQNNIIPDQVRNWFRTQYPLQAGSNRDMDEILNGTWSNPVMIHIRPRDNPYDKSYYHSNQETFLRKLKLQRAYAQHILFEGKVQDFTNMIHLFQRQMDTIHED